MPNRSSDPIQEQLIEARRNQILDAATTVFAEKGFHRATIRDVAQAAGIADGTIYNYFDNKTGLLLGILNRLNQTERREDDFAAGEQMEIGEFLRIYMRQRYDEMMQQGFEVFQIVMAEILVNRDLRELYFQQVIEPTYALAERYLNARIDAGAMRPIDTHILMRALAGMTLGILLLRIIGDPELEAKWDDLPDLLADLILNGIKPVNEGES